MSGVKDRRKCRLPFGIRVFTKQGPVGYTTDISIDSCYIALSGEFDKEGRQTLFFELPDSLEVIETHYKVLRQEEKGLAIHFLMEETDQVKLQRFIRDWGVIAD